MTRSHVFLLLFVEWKNCTPNVPTCSYIYFISSVYFFLFLNNNLRIHNRCIIAHVYNRRYPRCSDVTPRFNAYLIYKCISLPENVKWFTVIGPWCCWRTFESSQKTCKRIRWWSLFFRGLCPLIYRISVALHEEIIQVFHLLFILFFSHKRWQKDQMTHLSQLKCTYVRL